jgi:hypothetical protein
MIKLFACLFMLIDHIGYLFFPQYLVLRAIGRLSMPLFAYCVARGYYYSEQKGKVKKYALNMTAFALVSQLPYHFFVKGTLNIGATWLLSILLLFFLMKERRHGVMFAACMGIFLLSVFIPVDYGLCGVLYPLCFYLFILRARKPLYVFAGTAALFAIYTAQNGSSGLTQVFTMLTLPVLLLLERFDGLVHINKRFFYAFYPVHITILLIIKSII